MSNFNEFMNNLWNSEGQQISVIFGDDYLTGTITDTRYMYGNDIAVTIDEEHIVYGSELFNGDVTLEGVFI